ncbi:MAG: DUF262 domain-containing protein [Deltaproteobacteria bacterium]|nr:DUF262 domain-containing protein [Deltaproteobacteria bacterium]
MSAVTKSLRLFDIADWQINALSAPARDGALKVELPSLQRGYVWSVKQVEELWDSLIRGIPLGAFLLGEYDGALARRAGAAGADYFLLDGQQRATAIGLGFAPLWGGDGFASLAESRRNPTAPALNLALWVDLALPGDAGDNLAYKFRLLSRSHPWGYQRENGRRLEARDRYQAMDAFEKALTRFLEKTDPGAPIPLYPSLPIGRVWPWDATLPIPFPLLANAVRASEGESEKALALFREKIEGDPFWPNCGDMPTRRSPCWKAKLLSALKRGEGESLSEAERAELQLHGDRLRHLTARIWRLKDFAIPCLFVPKNDNAPGGIEGLEGQPSLLELSFNRVNSLGTTLEGEELVYSEFKAIFPRCETLVETIGRDAHVRPSRLISLALRLVKAETSDKESAARLPGPLSARQFRKDIQSGRAHGEFRASLSRFIGDGDRSPAKELFRRASDILVGHKSDDKNEVTGLGRILTAALAQDFPDLYFLLLSALRNGRDGADANGGISETEFAAPEDRRRILGVLTALAWFALDPSEFAGRLWSQKIRWWNAPKGALFAPELMKPKKNGQAVAYPLPSAHALRSAMGNVVSEEILGGAKRVAPAHLIYPSSWQWAWKGAGADEESYLNFEGRPPKGLIFEFPAAALAENETHELDFQREAFQREAWKKFWKTATKERGLILFAQRAFTRASFPRYEPESPDQLEDSDRPYDWDHILPLSLCAANHCRGIWKYWGQSVGNLRAWPRALNRADRDSPPAVKLRGNFKRDVLEDSFIAEGAELDAWMALGEDGGAIRKSLSDWRDAGTVGPAALKAITERLLALYQNWRDALDVQNSLGVEAFRERTSSAPRG